MPEIQTNNVRLYYEEHGAGEPLVLIPGFGTGLWIWFKQVPVFAERFRTIVFDPRGVARSEGRDEPVTIRLIADDVAALLDELGIRNRKQAQKIIDTYIKKEVQRVEGAQSTLDTFFPD